MKAAQMIDKHEMASQAHSFGLPAQPQRNTQCLFLSLKLCKPLSPLDSN